MTRRVRFSPLLVAGVLAGAAALARPPAAQGADVPFLVQAPVSGSAAGATRVFAADVDGDGDTDVLSTSIFDSKLAWYENAGTGAAWTTRTIATIDSPYALAAADVDGDGDTDVLSASHTGDTVTWYENTAGNGSAWTTRTVATGTAGALSVFAADVDRDGDRDVLVASFTSSILTWHENTAGNGSAWTTHTLSTDASGAFSVFAADVDGDGDTDVLSASSLDNKIAWYENTAGNGSAWTTRTVTTGALSAFAVSAADVDGDGDTDVVSASYGEGKIAWYENTAGNGSAWTTRTITTSAVSAYSVFVADVDSDGDSDVLSTSLGDGKVAWYENTAGHGTAWTTRTISTNGSFPSSVFATDVDGDGDTDVLSVSLYGGRADWYRNDSIHRTACFVTPPPITTAADRASSVFGIDVDGDGDTDVLSASYDKVAWYENVAGDGAVWITRIIATPVPASFVVFGADVDGDGDTDVLSASFSFPSNRVGWYENAAGDGTAWVTHTITTATDSVASVFAADVDGDGDTDVLSAAYFDNTVAWHENTAGNGSAWTTRVIATGAGDVHAVVAADVDGDGDTDALSASLVTDKVAWHENAAGNGTAWVTHTIATAVSAAVSVVAADVDGDGDTDAISAAYFSDTVAWHENTTGNGSAWATRTISMAPNGVEAVFAADLDGDGDTDVLSASRLGDEIAWYENAAGSGSSWIGRTIATADRATYVFAADVDGDGDEDALSASAWDDRIAWYDDRSGQLSLSVTDTAPPAANNGDLVSMLSIGATHLGRAGDHDLELASLGVLFEEAPGDPLTTAEANALVETLRVYRDGNGNGVFEPGTDVLVASVPLLSLTSGIQAVSFPDGDANVQVAFGSPRTYFLVVELTADASQQSVNQFRVTHLGLGAAASVAEDRDFDIPLRLSCPADVSSSIKQVVPVELMGFTIE